VSSPNVQRWFVTAPGRTYYTPTERTGADAQLLHAKEPGGTHTRCGVPAYGWPISWEIPFDAKASWACRECGAMPPDPSPPEPKSLSN
jgi:hypothetical protein